MRTLLLLSGFIFSAQISSAQANVTPVELIDMLRHADQSALTSRYPNGVNGGGFSASLLIDNMIVIVDLTTTSHSTLGIAVIDPTTEIQLVMIDHHVNGDLNRALMVSPKSDPTDVQIPLQDYIDTLNKIANHIRQHK